MQDKVDKVHLLPSTLTALEKILKEAWAKIIPKGLKNLWRFVPGRIQAVLEAKSGNVIK